MSWWWPFGGTPPLPIPWWRRSFKIETEKLDDKWEHIRVKVGHKTVAEYRGYAKYSTVHYYYIYGGPRHGHPVPEMTDPFTGEGYAIEVAMNERRAARGADERRKGLSAKVVSTIQAWEAIDGGPVPTPVEVTS